MADFCYVPVLSYIYRYQNQQPKHQIINNNNNSMSSTKEKNQQQTVVMPSSRTERDVFTVTALRNALDQVSISAHQKELILEQLFIPPPAVAAAPATPVASGVAAPSAVARLIVL